MGQEDGQSKRQGPRGASLLLLPPLFPPSQNNPYDKLQVTITLPTSDPLFRAKRAALQPHFLATQQTFDLGRNKPLPAALLPFMRLALATTSEQARLGGSSFLYRGKPACSFYLPHFLHRSRRSGSPSPRPPAAALRWHRRQPRAPPLTPGSLPR